MSGSTVVLSVLSSVVTSGLGVAGFEWWKSRRDQRWGMKRATCLEALTLIDAVFANRRWDGHPVTLQEKPSIADLRRVDNELALTCDNPAVINAYRQCLGLAGGAPSKASDLMALRDAIRTELGFGQSLVYDEETTYLGIIAEAKEES